MIGDKESEGKLNYELDFDYVNLMSNRMDENKHKYDPYNWTKDIDLGELIKANLRHSIKCYQSYFEDKVETIIEDPETLTDHLAALGCNSMMIYYQIK